MGLLLILILLGSYKVAFNNIMLYHLGLNLQDSALFWTLLLALTAMDMLAWVFSCLPPLLYRDFFQGLLMEEEHSYILISGQEPHVQCKSILTYFTIVSENSVTQICCIPFYSLQNMSFTTIPKLPTYQSSLLLHNPKQ